MYLGFTEADAQNHSLLALEKELNEHRSEDTVKVNLLNQLSKSYRRQKPTQALNHAREALDLSRALQFKKGEAIALNNLGIVYTNRGKYQEAEVYLQEAYQLMKVLKDFALQSGALTSLGVVANKQGDYSKALRYYQEALLIQENLGNTLYMAMISVNMGNIYFNQKYFRDAERFYLKALPIIEELNNQRALAVIYNNLGNIYGSLEGQAKDRKEMVKKAIEYYQLSFQIKEKLDDKLGIAATQVSLAGLYNKLDSLKQAETLFLQSAKMYDEVDNQTEKTITLTGLSALQAKKGELHEGLINAHKAMREAKKEKSPDNLWRIHLNASNLYEKTKQYDSALYHYKQQALIKDSLFDRENIIQISRLEANYQLEKEKIKMEAKLKEEKTQRHIYLGSSLGLLLILAIIIYFLRAKQRDNRILSEQRNRLYELNATKDKLFAIVAHDLKNPLSAFRAITQSLSDNLGTISQEEIHYFLSKINHSSAQLYHLLQNLLQWAVTQTGQWELRVLPLEVKSLSQEVLSQLQTPAELKRLDIHNGIDSAHRVMADHKMFALILRNILSNAIKFTPAEGCITLRSEEKENYIQISVEDSGIGIDAEDQQKLFKISESTAQIGSSPEKGTGLGLILSRELVEKQEGQIWVESEPEQGSTFFFTLPKV